MAFSLVLPLGGTPGRTFTMPGVSSIRTTVLTTTVPAGTWLVGAYMSKRGFYTRYFWINGVALAGHLDSGKSDSTCMVVTGPSTVTVEAQYTDGGTIYIAQMS